MADDLDIGGDPTPGQSKDIWSRSTAPQSAYDGREIGYGIAVLLVGLLVAFGLPLALV